MHPEIAAYHAQLRTTFERIAACVEQMPPDSLDWQPPAPGANSACVIVRHVMGNARAWLIGIVAGEPLRRDRPGEFASTCDDVAELARHVRDGAAAGLRALEALPPERLDLCMTPPRELWGEGAPVELRVRDAVIHVIEHASMHLGHLALTADLARARKPG